ncbi:hypothetical protein C0J52_08336 [Blattella germanica]|nr:hypothetical protein C0J52_08336 [Blattella germanica]
MDSGIKKSNEIPMEIKEAAKAAEYLSLPPKSREVYEKEYEKFVLWRTLKHVDTTNETIMLAFISEQSKVYMPSTLWCLYSKVKTMVKFKEGVDCSSFTKVVDFLKMFSKGHQAKNSKVLSRSEIDEFLLKAPDDRYLLIKVATAFGIYGACRRHELHNLCVDDVDVEVILVSWNAVPRVGILAFPIQFQCRLLPGEISNKVGDTVHQAQTCKSPRLIKSHLPLDLLPYQLWTVKPKVIYVARNAKATAVSYYHHYRMFEKYTGTLEDFVDAFVDGIVEWGPFWKHILDFWEIRDGPNVMFHTFEDMKKDLPGSVKKIATFLNCKYNSTQLEELSNYVSFDSMKKNTNLLPSDVISFLKTKSLDGISHQFFRKGETNSWKLDLSPEMIKKIDKWTEEQLKGTGYVE